MVSLTGAEAYTLSEQAYAYAFKQVFYSSIPFGIIAIICACFIKDSSQYLTNHTAVHMVGEKATHGADSSESESTTGSQEYVGEKSL
jgi:hypothetical protein